MSKDAIQQIKEHLKLISAQALILSAELKDGSYWGSDESRKVSSIYESLNKISILKDYR